MAAVAKKKGQVRKTTKKREGENYTPEQRAEWKQARLSEQKELLEAAVAQLTSSEAWENFVKFGRKNLGRLSLNNALLIWSQRKDATVVWGEKQWTKKKVNILPGAQRIKYLAPSGFFWLKDKNGDPILDANGKQQRRMFFRVVVGYDVKDTDAPVSDVTAMVELEGDDMFSYASGLERWARTLGYSVQYVELSDGRDGSVNERMGTININKSLSGNQMVHSLIHELLHVYGNVNYKDYDRATAEVLVESATVMTLGMIGYDVTDTSVPYIASWSDGNLEALTKYMKLVDELVKEAVERMENDVDASE